MEEKTTLIKFDLISLAKVIVFLLILVFLYLIRDILLLLIISFIISALLNPLIDLLVRKKIHRVLSASIVYLFLLLIVVGIAFLVIPTISQEGGGLIKKLSVYYESVESFLRNNQISVLPVSWENFLAQWQGNLGNIGQGLFTFLGNFLTAVFSVFIILALSFYLSVQRESWHKFFLSLASGKYKPFILKLIESSEKSLSAWGRGQLFLCFFIGLLSYLGLKILGIQFALLLAVIAAVTELIPRIGPIVGSLPAILIALLQDPVKAISVIILYTVVQQLENLVIMPQVMRKVVGLNPIAVIIVILIGAKIAGIIGAIIAVPITVVIVIVVKEYRHLKESQQITDGKIEQEQ